jgi:hypothetical protein
VSPALSDDVAWQAWLLKVLRIMLGLPLPDHGAHYRMQIWIDLHSKGLFLCPCFSTIWQIRPPGPDAKGMPIWDSVQRKQLRICAS